MTIRPWPSDGSTVDFTDLVEPLVDLMRQRFVERPDSDTLTYDGYDVGAKHVCLGIDELIEPANMAWQLEDQGRDALEVLVAACVQVGIEQGRRVARNEIAEKVKIIKLVMGKDWLKYRLDILERQ